MDQKKINKRAADFLCDVKFTQALPLAANSSRYFPFNPKMAPFFPYRLSNVEKDIKYSKLYNPLKDISLDFVDVERYASVAGVKRKQKKETVSETALLEKTNKSIKEVDSENPKHKASLSIRPADKMDNIIEIGSNKDVLDIIESSFEESTNPLSSLEHPLKKMKAVNAVPLAFSSRKYFRCIFDTEPQKGAPFDGVDVSAESDESAILKALTNATDPNDDYCSLYLKKKKHPDQMVYAKDLNMQKTNLHNHFLVTIPKFDSEECASMSTIPSQFTFKKKRSKNMKEKTPHSLQIVRQN